MKTYIYKWFPLKLSGVLTLIMIAAIVGFQMTGCKDDTVAPGPANNFKFSLMSSAAVSDALDNLILDTVKILIKDIKLNVSSSSDSNNFKTGPYVLLLNLNSAVNLIGAGYIPPGFYDKVQFEVHTLSATELIPDPDFASGPLRFSVVVKGSFNGIRFVYKSDKSAKQKLSFPNSLIVTESLTNITLHIKPYLWFLDSNNLYIDPTIENNRNKIDNNIKDNIKANFKAFKDNNLDGLPD